MKTTKTNTVSFIPKLKRMLYAVMDIKTVFRNLVKNQYMDDFDYDGTEFSFQTVFHMDTVFSYCLCTCAFEHEFVDYITEKGTIDEEKYEKIVKCIIDGKCPHVSLVPEDFVKETTINGIHIASAVGTIKAFTHNRYTMTDLPKHTSLYHTGPYALALRNNNAKLAMSYLSPYDTEYLIRANHITDDKSTVHFEAEELPDFLARTENLGLLEHYVFAEMISHGGNLFQVSVLHNMEKIPYIVLREFLYDIASVPNEAESRCLFHFHIWTLYYDRAKLFENLLRGLLSMPGYILLLGELNYMCELFKSVTCRKVLKKYGFDNQCYLGLRTDDKVKVLIDVLLCVPSILMTLITDALKKIPNLSGSINAVTEDGRMWNYFFDFYRRIDKNAPEVLKIILDCGINMDKTDSKGETPIIKILQQFIGRYPIVKHTREILTIRQTVELCIFQNIDVGVSQMAVVLAGEVDTLLNDKGAENSFTSRNFHLTGVFSMDVKEHSLFGHDRADDYALNFMIPLFLESGFRLTNVSLDLLTDERFHPEEAQYLHSFISMPRSLKALCRDSLRKHFKGRQIYCFVKQSNIPKSIEDFILLRPLLKAVPTHLLS